MSCTMTIALRKNLEGFGRSELLHAFGTSTQLGLLNCGYQSSKSRPARSETALIIPS
jgi:hypothetical protein